MRKKGYTPLDESSKQIQTNLFGKRAIALTIAIFALFVIIILNIDIVKTNDSPLDEKYESLKISYEPILQFKISNKYTIDNPIYEGYEWSPFIVEAYQTTTLTSFGGDPSSLHIWEVDGTEIGRGPSIDYVFGQPSRSKIYNIKLTEITNEGITNEFKKEVMCKYVRREIRKLTEDDRNKLFDAMQVMSTLDLDEGKSIYGQKYRNHDYFNKKHGGMAGTCSQFHKGPQFLLAHIAFTLEYEQSLQAIDPSISMPYWDFTIDAHLYGDEWRDSEVLSEDWLGPATSDHQDHVVASGRWAFTPILSGAWEFSTKHNSYGLLTDEWNNINSPYLHRYDHLFDIMNTQPLPTCGNHFACLTAISWMNFTDCLESIGHENVHQLIGGVWDTPKTLGDIVDLHPNLKDLFLWVASRADRAIQQLKGNGYLTCPDQCDISTPFSNCQCSCPTLTASGLTPELLDNLTEMGIFDYFDYYDFYNQYIIPVTDNNIQITFSSSYLIEELPDNAEHTSFETTFTFPWKFAASSSRQQDIEIVFDILKLYCSPGKIGDMYTSFSTNDPTFWLIHPTIERIWHWKSLINNPSFIDIWRDTHSCQGHNFDDTLPFTNFFNDKSDGSFYTNRELKDLFNPRNADLSYIYDNFEWTHCDEEGLDFINAPLKLGLNGY